MQRQAIVPRMGWRVVVGMLEKMGDVHLFVPQCRQGPEIVAKASNPGEFAVFVGLVEFVDGQKLAGEFVVTIGRTAGDVVEIAKDARRRISNGRSRICSAAVVDE